MAQIIPINQTRQFSLVDAQGLLPVIRRVTNRAVKRYRQTRSKLETMSKTPEQRAIIEEQLHGIMLEWSDALLRLGCESRGLWIVDFDCGDGYYCWKFPEEDVSFYHPYDSGFAGRIPVDIMSEDNFKGTQH